MPSNFFCEWKGYKTFPEEMPAPLSLKNVEPGKEDAMKGSVRKRQGQELYGKSHIVWLLELKVRHDFITLKIHLWSSRKGWLFLPFLYPLLNPT